MAGLVRKAELWALRLIAASIIGVPLVLFVVAHLLARQMPTLHVITDRPAIAAYIPPTGAQPVIPYGSSTATFPIGGTVAVTGTVNVNVLNTLNVAVSPTAVQFVAPSGTFSVSVQNTVGVNCVSGCAGGSGGTVVISPTIQPVVPTGTFSVSVQNTVGVAVQNTVGVIAQATVPISAGTLGVSVQNTPAVQGSVSLNNTPGVLVQGTIGVAVQNTPAIQGSVSINNTPGVAIQNTVPVTEPTADPCLAPGVVKSDVAVSIATATLGVTTIQAVASSAGKQIFICGFVLASTGTAGTPTPVWNLIQASGTATATCPTPIVGQLGNQPALSAPYQISGGTQFAITAGNKLCVQTQGGGQNLQGVITYVQQ